MGGYMPHGHCIYWETDLLWLMAISDVLIGLAYLSIPVALLVLARRTRQRIVVSHLLLLFASFIVLCGATHFWAAMNMWKGWYWAEAWTKALTALVSLWTLPGLVRALPGLVRALRAGQQVTALADDNQVRVAEILVAVRETAISLKRLASQTTSTTEASR